MRGQIRRRHLTASNPSKATNIGAGGCRSAGATKPRTLLGLSGSKPMDSHRPVVAVLLYLAAPPPSPPDMPKRPIGVDEPIHSLKTGSSRTAWLASVGK